MRCRIAGQFDGKTDEKKRGKARGAGAGGGTERGEEIWGYGRVAGKKFPDEFSRRSDLGRRILTPVLRRREKETDIKERRGGEKKERARRKEKPLKRALRRLYFSRPPDFGDQIRKPYYLNFFAL